MSLSELARMTEDEARTYLEGIRWPNGPVCPHCGSVSVTRLQGEAHRPGLLKCRDCRQQFSVTVGGVMEGTHLPLRQWALAFHLIASSKKGFSALQLQRNLGLGSYRTAWYMAHRIREAMSSEPAQQAMVGVVEADETYVGGKGKGRAEGRSTKQKTPVLGVVQREGGVHVEPVARVDGKTLKGIIREVVDRSATVMTDEWGAYRGLGTEFAGGHETVKHLDGQYARRVGNTVAHTNTAESFFALIKRGYYGIYHHMSRKHLARYCEEFSFRWDHRKVTDGQRTTAAIRGAAGKHLTYDELVGR